jgi:hypothetical protein
MQVVKSTAGYIDGVTNILIKGLKFLSYQFQFKNEFFHINSITQKL